MAASVSTLALKSAPLSWPLVLGGLAALAPRGFARKRCRLDGGG